MQNAEENYDSAMFDRTWFDSRSICQSIFLLKPITDHTNHLLHDADKTHEQNRKVEPIESSYPNIMQRLIITICLV